MKSIFLLILMLSNIFITEQVNTLTLQHMMEEVKKIGKMKKIAVAGGENLTMLQCCRQAKDLKIADSILVGDAAKIREVASGECRHFRF